MAEALAGNATITGASTSILLDRFSVRGQLLYKTWVFLVSRFSVSIRKRSRFDELLQAMFVRAGKILASCFCNRPISGRLESLDASLTQCNRQGISMPQQSMSCLPQSPPKVRLPNLQGPLCSKVSNSSASLSKSSKCSKKFVMEPSSDAFDALACWFIWRESDAVVCWFSRCAVVWSEVTQLSKLTFERVLVQSGCEKVTIVMHLADFRIKTQQCNDGLFLKKKKQTI